jgi:uncharacterized FAD-dependent dehydrogenase
VDVRNTAAKRHTLTAQHVVTGIGPQRARDTFTMLHRHAVTMEAKPFSVGVRIEHPQSVIDRARWGAHAGHPLLGAADYKLVAPRAPMAVRFTAFACAQAARWWPPPANQAAW